MDLRHVRAFVAIVDAGGFARAGVRLNLSQPGLAWDPRRFLAPYAEEFVEELVAYVKRASTKPSFARRAPPLPRPKEPSDLERTRS